MSASAHAAPRTASASNYYVNPAPSPTRQASRLSSSGAARSSAGFNTDYRTRPTGTAVPVALSGRGFNGYNLPIGQEDAYRKSLPSDYAPTDLVLIPRQYWYYGSPVYLRREAADSLVRMFSDAERLGLHLQVFSGFRDIGHQRRLYYEAVSRNPRQKMVAKPGNSEHMLGTVADVTNSKQYLMRQSFVSTPEGRWLKKNAPLYGFVNTVLHGSGTQTDEPWHFRYMGRQVIERYGGYSVAQQPESTPRQPRGLFSSFRRSLSKITNVGPLKRHLESDPAETPVTDQP